MVDSVLVVVEVQVSELPVGTEVVISPPVGVAGVSVVIVSVMVVSVPGTGVDEVSVRRVVVD